MMMMMTKLMMSTPTSRWTSSRTMLKSTQRHSSPFVLFFRFGKGKKKVRELSVRF